MELTDVVVVVAGAAVTTVLGRLFESDKEVLEQARELPVELDVLSGVDETEV